MEDDEVSKASCGRSARSILTLCVGHGLRILNSPPRLASIPSVTILPYKNASVGIPISRPCGLDAYGSVIILHQSALQRIRDNPNLLYIKFRKLCELSQPGRIELVPFRDLHHRSFHLVSQSKTSSLYRVGTPVRCSFIRTLHVRSNSQRVQWSVVTDQTIWPHRL